MTYADAVKLAERAIELAYAKIKEDVGIENDYDRATKALAVLRRAEKVMEAVERAKFSMCCQDIPSRRGNPEHMKIDGDRILWEAKKMRGASALAYKEPK